MYIRKKADNFKEILALKGFDELPLYQGGLYCVLYVFAYLNKSVTYLNITMIVLSSISIIMSFKIEKIKLKYSLVFIGIFSFIFIGFCNIWVKSL
jgi:hypothetical protein